MMTMTKIDEQAVAQAVRRATRSGRRWSADHAVAECRRVADLHGCDGEASAEEARKRIDSWRSLRRSQADEAAEHRAAIVSRHAGLSAYRLISLATDRKSSVFYCRDDARAERFAREHLRLDAFGGSAQVVRLLADGQATFVAVLGD